MLIPFLQQLRTRPRFLLHFRAFFQFCALLLRFCRLLLRSMHAFVCCLHVTWRVLCDFARPRTLLRRHTSRPCWELLCAKYGFLPFFVHCIAFYKLLLRSTRAFACCLHTFASLWRTFCALFVCCLHTFMSLWLTFCALLRPFAPKQRTDSNGLSRFWCYGILFINPSLLCDPSTPLAWCLREAALFATKGCCQNGKNRFCSQKSPSLARF